MRKLSILLILLMLGLAACAGDPTPTATAEPVATEEVVVTEEATAEAVEATEEMATEEAVVEATEEMATEEPMEATEEMATEEAAVEATEEVAMATEEATEELATEEAVVEATEELATEEVVVEATEELATEEAVVEATEELATEEAVVEATEVPMEVTEEAPAVAAWVCPEGFAGQSLNVYNWSTYIADDTIPNFEAACGVTIVYDTFDSNEAVLSRLRQGNPGYDIIVPSGDTIAIMIREGLLIPLNKDVIPNIANLNPTLMNAPYDPGNVYSLPYQWGTIGIGYNTEKFPDGITSWEQLWSYEGPVAWLDDRRSLFGLALLILGYDPNTENADEIEAAKRYLEERSSNVVTIAADDGQELLARGDVDATIEYSGDIFAIADECECDTYAYSIPSEGANLWTDNLAVPVGAENPELAMVFIDYILDAQVGADISNYTAYASPNQAAIDLGLIDADYLSDPAIYPSAEVEERLYRISEVSSDAELLYTDAWDELLIFITNN